MTMMFDSLRTVGQQRTTTPYFLRRPARRLPVTLYLAKALRGEKSTGHQDRTYQITTYQPPHDHTHAKETKTQREGILMPLQYADDLSRVGVNCPEVMAENEIKARTHALLEESNLHINPSKTEEYNISIASKDGDWRKCK